MIQRFALGALAAALLSLAPAAGVAAAGPSPFGLWARGDGIARVRVEACGADLCATNTWIRDGVKNERVGDVLVMSVKPTDANRWSGTAFDRQRDLNYRMTLIVDDATMTTRGCVLAGVICKDMNWTRVKGE